MDVEDVFEKWDDSKMMDMKEIESVVGCEKERSKKCEEGKDSDLDLPWTMLRGLGGWLLAMRWHKRTKKNTQSCT